MPSSKRRIHFREPVNGLPHLVAAVLAAIGLIQLLILGHGNLPKQITLLIYGVSLILMFSASATYHLVQASPPWMRFLRKMDHSAIYLLIAGTYTPICFHFFEGFYRWGILCLVWGMAVAGIIVKLVTLRAPRWLTAAIYLAMGWLAVIGTQEMLREIPVGAVVWILLGGGFFTVGAVIYILKKPNFLPGRFGFHELWHVFVILGCLSFYVMITFYIASPGLVG